MKKTVTVLVVIGVCLSFSSCWTVSSFLTKASKRS